MSDRSAAARIDDIPVHAQRAIGFPEGCREPGALAADETSPVAVVRAREVVSEAAEPVPPAVRRRFPDRPRRPMAGMRDRPAQDRCELEPEIVRRTVVADLPPLLPRPHAVLRILASATDQKGRPAR